MSLFGTNHTVVFASVVYNLAGLESKRPNFLKTAVAGSMLNSTDLVSTLTSSYINGPGIKLRTFANWAQSSGYNSFIGMSGSALVLEQTVDQTTLATLIPSFVTVGSDQTVVIQGSRIGIADFTQWADQYVALNFPAFVGTAYTAALDVAGTTITVTFVDTTTATFTPTSYNPVGRYLYTAYSLATGASAGPLVTGSTITSAMPSTVGWTEDSSLAGVTVWERTTFQGEVSGNSITSLREVMTQDSIVGTYRIDTQTITRTWSDIDILIYEFGSGNSAMDALFNSSSNNGDFFPYIPIRTNFTFISPSYFPSLYTQGKKALKKSVNGNFDKIVTDIAGNSSIGFIDNAVVTFGVSLNVVENSCKKYIYKFFQEVMTSSSMTGDAYRAWLTAWNTANTAMQVWRDWAAAQSDPTSALYGLDPPDQPTYPAAPISSITVASDPSTGLNYASTVEWSGIAEVTGFGRLTPLGSTQPAAPGQIWFEVIDASAFNRLYASQLATFAAVDSSRGSAIRLNWQIDLNHWRYLDIYGLTHTQQLFKNNTVTINAIDALNDPNESGFIIPLHRGVLKSMSLVDSTQMSTACAFLVFTTAVVHKSQWYQSGLFQIFIIIVIVIVVVVVEYFTFGTATPGLLGTAGAVGSALGLTGTAAIIAGLVVNALAAMVLTKIITTAATTVFGPKIGPIIGAVTAVIVSAGITDLTSGTSLVSNFSGMSLITNLSKLTVAVGDGIAQYMQASAQDIMGKTQQLETSYTQDSQQIQKQSLALLGSNNGIIDPVAYSNAQDTGDTSNTNSSNITSVSSVSSTREAIETPDLFLARTLMTGSDLADISMNMITNFALLTLNTELPI